MILYILLLLFVILSIWILFGPLILSINTERSRYLLTLPGIFRAHIVPTQYFFYARVWIFFFPLKIDPLKIKRGGKGEKKREKEKKAGSKEKSLRKSTRKIGNLNMLPVIRAFRIRKLKLDFDSDDFMLNAMLVPVFSKVNGRNIMMQVNFEGNLALHLETRTRIGSLLWILFKYR